MTILSRLLASAVLAPGVLAAGIGLAAMVPAPAQAQDATLTRVLVDVADVVLQGGQPYYRYGHYGPNDRLVMQRDRYGRPVYYRVVPARVAYYPQPRPVYYPQPYQQPAQRVTCSHSGNCTVKYYDPRYDHQAYQARYDNRGRGRGNHRGHDDDD